MDSIYKLQQRASILSEKTQTDSITPKEVGGLHADTLAYIAAMEQNLDSGLGIRKIYRTVSEMNTEAVTPIGTNGLPIRSGQLVTIYDPDEPTAEEAGNVYTFQNPGWTLAGNLNALPISLCNQVEAMYKNSIRQSVMVTKQLLYRRIDIVHPTDWTSTEGLAAWVHTRRQHYLLSSASALFSPTDGQLYEIGTACNDLPVGTGGDIHIKMVITGKNNLVRLYVAVEPYNYVQVITAGNVTFNSSNQAEFDSITPTVPCRSLDIAKLNEKITSILDDLNTHSADISILEQCISGVGEAHESEFQDLAQRIQTNAENIEAVGQAVTENYAELDDRLFINETETEQQRADINALQNKIKSGLIKQSTFTTKTLLYRRIDIVHPTDWSSNTGLATWIHTRRQHYLLSSASALFSPTDGQLYEIGTACNNLPVGTTDADIHIKMVISGKNNLVRLYVAVEPYNYVQVITSGDVTFNSSSQAEFDSITPTVPCRSLDIQKILTDIQTLHQTLTDTTPPLIPAPEGPYSDANQITRTGIYHPTINTPDNTGTPCTLIVHAATYPEADLTITEQTAYTRNPQTGNPDGRIYKRLLTSGCEPTDWIQITA